MQRAVERIKGFYDVDAVAFRRFSAALSGLLESFRLAGYQQMDVPAVEQLELYLRKSGADVLSHLYGFSDQSRRELALRPEFTASIIRAISGQMMSANVPVRVSYGGPVFRYERPQRATARQFTQAGVELLGESQPHADAEIISLACHAAHDIGINRLRLVIGHLAPLRALLSHLRIEGYAAAYLIEHLEYYNRGPEQRQTVRHRLGLHLPQDEQQLDSPLPAPIAAAIGDATLEEAREIVASLLDQMGLDVGGSTRTPDEIIDRVVSKARRQAVPQAGGHTEHLERALSFAEWLGPLRGAPGDILPQVEELFRRNGVPLTTLQELHAVLGALDDHDLPGVTVELAPGMARGIGYYTGTIFELYTATGEIGETSTPLQICGGGRYDGLARALAGRHEFPALGFAFGIERLLHALPAMRPVVAPEDRLILLIPDEGWRRDAVALAGMLRTSGLVAIIRHLRGTAEGGLEHARQAGFSAAVVFEANSKPIAHYFGHQQRLASIVEDLMRASVARSPRQAE